MKPEEHILSTLQVLTEADLFYNYLWFLRLHDGIVILPPVKNAVDDYSVSFYGKGDSNSSGIPDNPQIRSQLITFGSTFREDGKTLAKGNDVADVTLCSFLSAMCVNIGVETAKLLLCPWREDDAVLFHLALLCCCPLVVLGADTRHNLLCGDT